MKHRSTPARAIVALLLVSASCGGSTSTTLSANGSAEVHSGDEPAATQSGSAPRDPDARPSTSTAPGPAGMPPRPGANGVAPEPSSSAARYLVVVDEPQSLVPRLDRATLAPAYGRLREVVGGLDGVAVSNESRAAIAARTRGGETIGLVLRCSILRVDVGPQGTRAAVSMVVARLENESVLGSLSGGALAPGSTGPAADREAVAGAIESATRGLPQLLESL